MTRKHFKDIASALKGCKPVQPKNASLFELQEYASRMEVWKNTVRAMAFVCSNHNNYFDRSRFNEACNYQEC